MKNLNLKWKPLAVAILGLSLAQCSKEQLEKDFKVQMKNKSPLVRVTKKTLGETEISPNWFDVGMTLTNNTEYDVRVEEVYFYVDVDGKEEGPFSFDLGTMTTSNDEGVTFTYINYCVYSKGMTAPFAACRGTDTSADDYSGSPNPPMAKPILLYIGSIPVSTTDPTNLSYSVRMQLLGLFLDSNGNEVKRFDKQVNFSTQ